MENKAGTKSQAPGTPSEFYGSTGISPNQPYFTYFVNTRETKNPLVYKNVSTFPSARARGHN